MRHDSCMSHVSYERVTYTNHDLIVQDMALIQVCTKHANVFKYAQLCKSFKCNTVDSCHQHVDKFNARVFKYEVAAVSRIDKTIGLFCRISSLLCGSFAKETYDFIDPTNRGYLISCEWKCVSLNVCVSTLKVCI